MFSLGLGEIEFNPIHTIEQHHPNGYKVPEITDITDTSDNDVLSYNHTSAENATKKLETNSDNSGDADANTPQNSTNNNFKSLHDPKHRHPRHHGKYTDFLWLTMHNIVVF